MTPGAIDKPPEELGQSSTAGKSPESPINPDEILLDDELNDVAAPPPAQLATKFLALDKCLPRRRFLEVFILNSDRAVARFNRSSA